MFRRILALQVWTHPKYGTAARIAVCAVVIEIVRAFSDAYTGQMIGASLASDVFTSFLPMAWLPSGIYLGIFAKNKTRSLIIGLATGALAAAALLWGAIELKELLGPNAWI